MKELFYKYKEMILYLFFGGCTTMINIVFYAVSTRIFEFDTIASTILAWILSVLFAYATNRKYVFESTNTTCAEIVKEIVSFFSCRVFSGVLDLVIMWLFVDVIGYNDLVIKIISNVIVIIINYVASKWFVFKKEK